jgi:hypothetical protein
MTCTTCHEGHVYNAHCQPCRVRLVRSCRSTTAPKVSRKQQDGMLAYIERRAGAKAKEMTINELKGMGT